MAYNQDIIKQLIVQETTLTGTVDPVSVIPEFIGQLYINTSANTIWVAKSTTVGDFIEAGSGVTGVGGDKYIYRGDPSGWDFTNGDFIKDATYRDLDLSSILPPEAAGKLVHLVVQINTTVAGGATYLRPKGQINGYNVAGISSAEANKIHTEDVFVQCDENRVIQYYITTGYTWNNLDVLVRGWFEEELVDTLVRGDEYVDRGDPASFDFAVGDFTTDNTWHDLDLSSIVPTEGANQLVHLLVAISDDVSGGAIQFRKKDNSNTVNVAACTLPTANTTYYYDLWVRMDDNRIVEYKGSNSTFVTLNVAVRGWMKTSDGGAIAGTKYVDRGELSGWDVSSWTMDGNWHNLDLSSILPESAANQLVHIRMQGSDNSTTTAVSLAHPDALSGWNVARMYTRVASETQSQDVFVKCNNNREIAYNIPSGYDSFVIAIRGWMQPIDKGQAIQPTYGAPVVHMEWKDINTITVKAGRYFVDGGWYELESDLDWTWSAGGQNFGVDTGGGEANGWWYLYMFLYGDRPAVVASQIPPTGAYDTDLSGTTYDKNLYLGAYYNDVGSIREFYQSGREFFYSKAQDSVTTTSNTFQAKTIGVPVSADQVLGLIHLQTSGGSPAGNAFYSPNGVGADVYVGPRNSEDSTAGHYSQFYAPIVTPQTGYIRNGTNSGLNTAQMWTLGWKDKFVQ